MSLDCLLDMVFLTVFIYTAALAIYLPIVGRCAYEYNLQAQPFILSFYVIKPIEKNAGSLLQVLGAIDVGE